MLPNVGSMALENLGWRSFQDLSLTICEELFNAPVQQFSPVKDYGQDGLIELPYWNLRGKRRTVIQSKHTSVPAAKLSLAAVEADALKMAVLSQARPIDRYVLVTNLSATAGVRQKVISRFKAAGCTDVVLIEREGVERQIRQNAKLRAKVPRLYGIGDLSTIIDERRIEQSHAILKGIAADLITFVPTNSYRKAVERLNTNKIVVLLGDPASGKTTIANCLIIGSIDQSSADPVIIKSFDELRQFWNPRMGPRVFYFDDFLGPWSLSWSQLREFNSNLDFINGAMKSGCRFIFTSRNYIWNQALDQIKFGQLGNLKSSQVAIDLQELSALEKAQILFNHLRNGNQSKAWRTNFRQFYKHIVLDDLFTPECARRLSRTEFTQGLRPSLTWISRFVRQQGDCLVESIRGLHKDHRGALAAVYMSGGSLIGTRKEHPSVQAAMELYGMNVDDLRTAVASLQDVFIKQGMPPKEQGWVFKHPTIREAMATIVRDNSDLVEMAVRGNSVWSLLQESVCEGVSYPGATLVIPPGLFDPMIKRLREEAPWSGVVSEFLSKRASREFRDRFFEGPVGPDHPLIARALKPDEAGCELLGALLVDSLLKEGVIEAFDGALLKLARSLDSTDIPLSAWKVVGKSRFEEIVRIALSEIDEDRNLVAEHWAEGWSRDVSPDSYFQGLTDRVQNLAQAIGEQLDDEWMEGLYEDIGEYTVGMQDEYDRQAADDYEGDLFSPSPTPPKAQISPAEIDAIFDDVAKG